MTWRKILLGGKSRLGPQEQSESTLPPLDKFHEIEMQKMLDAMEGDVGREQQMASLFGTASIAVLGIGFSTQKAGLLFLAGVILGIFLVLDVRTRKHIAVCYYRGLQLQMRFAPKDNEFYLNILPNQLSRWVRELARMPEGVERIKALHNPPLRVQSVSGFWVPMVIGLIDVGLGLIM